MLLTTESLYRRKVASWRSELPSLRLVLLVGCEGEAPEGCVSLAPSMEAASDSCETVATRLDDARDASVARIVRAHAGSSAAFAGLSLWGYTTKKDLSGWGTFLIMGVVGLLVAIAINLFFVQSTTLHLVISAIGVLIFAGLTAYDTQRIKSMYAHVAGSDMMGKVVIMGALSLYLDFINMFTFLLNFMGQRE